DIKSNAVADDAQGDFFVTGSFLGTANFAPAPATANLTTTGSRDPFVAKYTKAGALVWAEHLKGSDSSAVAQGSAIAVDGAGDVYLAGTFTGTFNFDPGTGNTSITANANDIFVEKLDPNGNLLWVQDVPTTTLSYNAPYGLALDGAGNAYVSGSFEDQAEFGATTLTSGGGFDAFVAKFDASTGGVDWAEGTTGTGYSSAIFKGVAIDGSGNVLLTGYYAGTVDLDPTGGVATDSSDGGTQDIVVEKLDGGTGALSWAETIGGSDVDMGNAVAGDAAGNIYVTGTFSGPVDFDPGQGVTTLTSVGYNDTFLMKLSASGQLSWAEDLAGTTATSSGNGLGLALDGNGQVLVAGDFLGGIQLDPSGQTPGTTAAGSFDAFVAEYDDGNGGYLGGQSAGGTNLDIASGVAANAAGNVAVTGSYYGPANFAGTSLPEVGKQSIFLAQWTIPAAAAPPSAPSTPVLEAGSDTGASHSDDITAATTLVLDVNTAVATDTVELLRDGVVVGTRTGPGPITDPGPVPAGTHGYTAIQVDP
ncbi:MAG TPA: hypothetical protein VG406_01180, partial [Isosphaeraceae bacterium]|nr:hypothetical protein [Isosphaeraceae bacterium]